MNDLEKELATLMIGELSLGDIQLGTLTVDTPPYGEGLRFNSIDILKAVLLISRKHGFELRSDDSDNQKILAPLNPLAVYVAEHHTR